MSIAGASTASKAELAVARFARGKQKSHADDNDYPPVGGDAEKLKERRATLNRRATKIKNAPIHVQQKWNEIQNLGARQHKTRLQQEFEEHLMNDSTFSDSYWYKELCIDTRKKDDTQVVWQVREEVEKKLGGMRAASRRSLASSRPTPTRSSAAPSST